MSNHKVSDKVETVDASINTFGLDHKTFDGWVQVDDDLPGHCVLTENEIAECVLNSVNPNEEGEGSVEDEEEERAERQPVTRREMLRAMNILRRAIEENDIGEEKFSTLNNLEHALSTAINAFRKTESNYQFF